MTLPQDLDSTPAIKEFAGSYSPYSRHKDTFICEMLQVASKHGPSAGYLTRDELLMVDDWKNGSRNRWRVVPNEEDEVVEKSHRAFASEDILPLTQLQGIGLPTASAIMHFVFPSKYPIIDTRALSALGVKVESSDISDYRYGKKYWVPYQEKCCQWAKDYKVSLRILDRALWQYDLAQDGLV